MPRAKIGDVLEIPTAGGLAYAQYTHQHPMWGGLIRVFDRVFEHRPEDASEIAMGTVRFSTFLPVRVAVYRRIFQVIGNSIIADANKDFPIFRAGNIDSTTKKVAVWWLWDGEKEWCVGEITEEQRKLPLRAVWNDTLLIQRIESDWDPTGDF